MIFAIIMGVLSAFVALIVIARMGIKKFMGYPAFMDVAVTVALAWLLHGSYVGMVAAIIGGLTFSAMITVIRKAHGYSKLERRGIRLVWVDYSGEWHANAMHRIQQLKNQKENICLNLSWSKLLTLSIVGLCVLASVL